MGRFKHQPEVHGLQKARLLRLESRGELNSDIRGVALVALGVAFNFDPCGYSTLSHQGTTGFCHCFHLPGCHFRVTLFLTHGHIQIEVVLSCWIESSHQTEKPGPDEEAPDEDRRFGFGQFRPGPILAMPCTLAGSQLCATKSFSFSRFFGGPTT